QASGRAGEHRDADGLRHRVRGGDGDASYEPRHAAPVPDPIRARRPDPRDGRQPDPDAVARLGELAAPRRLARRRPRDLRLLRSPPQHARPARAGARVEDGWGVSRWPPAPRTAVGQFGAIVWLNWRGNSPIQLNLTRTIGEAYLRRHDDSPRSAQRP